MLNLQTILYPTDFSEAAECAFPVAVALARENKARLIVLYVNPPPVSYGEIVAERQEPSDHASLWQLLRTVSADRAGVRVEHRLEEGDAAATILSVAAKENADLIVIGTHGRTGLRRLLMGSVAEQIVRRASCLVLTVNQPVAAAAMATPEHQHQPG